MSERFAVIDTETTWDNQVMSIGLVVADSADYEPVSERYYILLPYKNHGGMYADRLCVNGVLPDLECPRAEALNDMVKLLKSCKVKKLFAYNAPFDYGHLHELGGFEWFDILKIAAYRQYNKKIPYYADCCKTGRLKSGFGVESIYKMLSGDYGYFETHNALFDARDELAVMKMLGLSFEIYNIAKINQKHF